jgi:hypothetical protein
MLLSIWSCAPGVSLVNLFCNVKNIALDFVKICNFQLSHVAQKIFDLCHETLRECWSACVVVHLGFRLWIYMLCQIIALDLVKICNFQFVSCVAQNIFNQKSWNVTGMLVSMFRCAPWFSLLGLSSICRVIIAFDLVKTVSLCCVICSLSVWVEIYQLY